MRAKILDGLRSPKFFLAILLLLMVESVWIAVSAAYPMVFDENTHFGIIQLHAQQWSPLFLHQPPNSDWAGALTRDPSYLYHWLMSLPYRLVANLTDYQAAQIVFLRLINVALFGSALVLFRQLFLRTKASPAIVHVTLLFFVLLPVVPLLAGQINYDNLVMPLAGLALLLTVSAADTLAKRKRLPITKILWLLTLGMLSCLVQFMFLPIFTGIVLWLGWRVWRQNQKTPTFKALGDLRSGWRQSSWAAKLAVGLPFILATALFVQMYGVNLIAYHTPIPQCGEVLSLQQCAAHEPAARNQHALATRPDQVDANPLLFGAGWAYRMFVGMFYTSSGGAGPGAWYLSINPLPVIFGTALMVSAVGVLLFLKYWRVIFDSYRQLGFLLFISLFYISALWLRNYHDYLHFGQKLAINGRYLFPVVLIFMFFVVLAYRQFLAGQSRLKIGLLAVVFGLFLQGGGALTYITVSQPAWYWQNPAVLRLNREAQRVVKPLIIIESPVRSVKL